MIKFFQRSFMTLFFLFSSQVIAQDEQAEIDPNETFHIVEIIVEGNKKTKSEVLLREMQTEAGKEASLMQLELDRRRIESLGLFTRVEMEAEERDQGIALIITVSEQWYIFPLPIVFFNDREYKLSKLSYGASVVHTNFRGRAELMQLTGWYGFNPQVSLGYSNPWILGDARLFFGATFFMSQTRNKSEEIALGGDASKERRVGGTLRFGKRLTLRTSLALDLGYRRLRFNSGLADSLQTTQRTLDPSGTDHLPQAGITLRRDYRDLLFYPTRGSYLSLRFEQTGVPGADFVDYRVGSVDLRKYFPLGAQSTFALRFASILSRGKVPVYDRVFLGYTHRIRGHFSKRYDSENRIKTSAEVRFPLMKVRYYEMGGGLGGYGQNLKFGVSGSLFFDGGSLWLQDRQRDETESGFAASPFGSQTSPKEWIYGFGFGLNFHLPYVQIARLELAFDEEFGAEVIFDAAISF